MALLATFRVASTDLQNGISSQLSNGIDWRLPSGISWHLPNRRQNWLKFRRKEFRLGNWQEEENRVGNDLEFLHSLMPTQSTESPFDYTNSVNQRLSRSHRSKRHCHLTATAPRANRHLTTTYYLTTALLLPHCTTMGRKSMQSTHSIHRRKSLFQYSTRRFLCHPTQRVPPSPPANDHQTPISLPPYRHLTFT